MISRLVSARAGHRLCRASLVVPCFILFMSLASCSMLRKEGPEVPLQKYLDLAADERTRPQAEEFTLQGGGGSALPTPGAGSGMPTAPTVPHMELEHMNGDGIPGATFTLGTPAINGTNATVPLNVKVGTVNVSIPVHMQQTADGWRVDLAQTNREIIRYERQLNDASAATTTSGQGGLGPGGGTRPAVPGR